MSAGRRTAGRPVRNLPAAFEEIRRGLSTCLRSNRVSAGRHLPGAGARRKGRSAREAVPPSDSLCHEATVHLLRLLFVLYADARGLLGAGQGWGRSGPAALGKLAIMAAESPERGNGPLGGGGYGLWDEFQRRLAVVGSGMRKGPAEGSLSLLDSRPGGRAPLKVPDANLSRAISFLGMAPGPGRRRGWPVEAAADLRGLGDAYEAVLEYRDRHKESSGRHSLLRSASLRKIDGRYYTPERVVDYVVGGALRRRLKGLSSRQILRIKVLDPAMGSGHFLLRAAEFLATAYARARIEEGKAKQGRRIPGAELDRYRRIVAERCLYGVDTDPIAVELARLSLWLYAGGTSRVLNVLGDHLRCGDALLGTTLDEETPNMAAVVTGKPTGPNGDKTAGHSKPFHWGIEFPEVVRGSLGRRSGFDVIIGNPPYASFSGRQKVAARGRAHRPSGTNDRPRGWPSMHGSFVLRAAELVGEAGIISFITPAQVGLLPGYGPVRSGLLHVCDLREVRYWGEDVFRGVTTPALTFIACRRRAASPERAATFKCDGRIRKIHPEGEAPWYVSSNHRVCRRIARLHGTIEGFRDPGVHTGNAAAKLLLPRPEPGSVPILEGRQVHPFRCDPPGIWLDLAYKPSTGEYFRISDTRIYRETDILIRQTASRPIAARHSHRCHFRNSALALRVPEGFSLEYLLGILNSEVAGMLYSECSPESLQRSFPQIKVASLKRLPVPDPRLARNRRAVLRIEEVVRSIEDLARRGRRTDGLVANLNSLVRNLYGLNEVRE